MTSRYEKEFLFTNETISRIAELEFISSDLNEAIRINLLYLIELLTDIQTIRNAEISGYISLGVLARTVIEVKMNILHILSKPKRAKRFLSVISTDIENLADYLSTEKIYKPNSWTDSVVEDRLRLLNLREKNLYSYFSNYSHGNTMNIAHQLAKTDQQFIELVEIEIVYSFTEIILTICNENIITDTKFRDWYKIEQPKVFSHARTT